ncbi:hypothetical protein MMC14_005734 [Varicellaria rhodocarpa]|nr:hypothetical protein [Varicellaria rhodocarpa]
MQASQWAPTSEVKLQCLVFQASRGANLRLQPVSVDHEDQFAQTRQPDDLFDDDFTPIVEPILKPPPSQHHSQPLQSRANNNEYPNRGRGRGHGTRPNNNDRSHTSQPQETSTTDPSTKLQSPPLDPENKPKPTPAARGNRLPTGGVQKPKLTEDELSARLAAAKLNNARREEAHRLAEADEAFFQQREEQAREKRREEGAARRQMEGERERNRLRKLGARGGREWDEGKKEEDSGARGGRGRGYRRGMHGGIVQSRNTDGEYFAATKRDGGEGESGYSRSTATTTSGGKGGEYHERGRGGHEGGRRRGGRGRGNRGRGRGDRGGDHSGNYNNTSVPVKEADFAEADFPALASGNANEKIHTLENADLQSSTGEKKSWADQVEASADTGQTVS